MDLALGTIFVLVGVTWLAYDSWNRRGKRRPSKPVVSASVANANAKEWRENLRRQHVAAHAPGRAVGFGYKTEWLAVRHHDASAVMEALELDGIRSASWPEGTWAIGDGGVFVTPPMRGFVLVAGRVLGIGELAELKAIPARLSAQLDVEVCAFVSYRSVGIYGWARARSGVVERVYLEGEHDVIVREGEEPVEEAALRNEYFAERAACGPQEVMLIARDSITTQTLAPPDDTDPHWADHDAVRRLAASWSLDPISFDAWPDEVPDGWIADGVRRLPAATG